MLASGLGETVVEIRKISNDLYMPPGACQSDITNFLGIVPERSHTQTHFASCVLTAVYPRCIRLVQLRFCSGFRFRQEARRHSDLGLLCAAY